MKTLIILFSVSVFSFAERVTLNLSQTPGCRHVDVRNAEGQTVGAFTIDELKEAIREGECPIACQIKTLVINSTATTNNQIKNMLESKEFTLK